MPYSSDFCPTYAQNLPDYSALIFFTCVVWQCSLLMTLPLSQVSPLLNISKYTSSNPKRTRFGAEPLWPLLKVTVQCVLLPPCRRTYCNETQVTLLYPLLQNGGPLIRTLLNANLRELSNILGYLENEYASHSFRIRATSTAAAAKLPCTIANQNA